ncbi:MAG TPA: NADPH-dependent F420 reductase [Xanthobacteraceae bacterium]|nr:NADPH-dependent F420 reductase [Xanthobacteraceae bacterium]
MENKPTIAIIGGTGDLGSGLARLLAAAGYSVVIGSRAKDKAEQAAEALASHLGAMLRGDDNRGAAQSADIVLLCVPFSNHDRMLEEIKPVMDGKILVDAVVPLVPPKVSVVQLPAAGSPALVAQRMLGPGVRVAAAFHNVGAKKLHGGERADCDVLVFADDAAVREQVIALADIVATRGVDGGVLANAVAAEALTSVLIAINRRYKIPGAGIRITGLPMPEAR